MRRFVLFTVVALLALTEACAVGPRYRRSSLGLPDGWRRPAVSEDSLRSFYDSLRTSRDTLLPAGADTARVPFAYDTASPAPRMDSTAALRWRSEEHTSELQSHLNLVCRLLLEKKKKVTDYTLLTHRAKI